MNCKCPYCGTKYEFEAEDLGQSVSCQVCGRTFALKDGPARISVPGQSTTSAEGREALSVRRPKMSAGSHGHVPLPDRLVKKNDAVAEKKSSVRRWSWKTVAILCAISVLLVAVAASVAGYLCFGDSLRLKRGCAQYARGEYPKAYATLLPLAQKGDAEAQVIIGDCYLEGRGVFQDANEAAKWYRMAAEQESPKALYRMFECCRDGDGVDRNIENAAKWCRKAADAGLVEAMYDMGMLYVDGDGVKESPKSAFKWFRKGAERGYPPALYKFGLCYRAGYGVDKDEDEAAKWQGKAVDAWRTMADAGDTDSMNRLGELYEKGQVVDLDKEEAVKWFRMAAERGNPNAQLNLAEYYFSGNVVEKDPEEGARLVLNAAEQGVDAASQLWMGDLYMNGNGVVQDDAEAFKWFARAAKRGSAMALYRLAMCYMNGRGVEVDAAKGESLLEEASAMGQEDARKELVRIRVAREEERRRLEEETTEKKWQIGRLAEIEGDIAERKKRINDVLGGKLKGDWARFDASKITMTDSSVSASEEKPWKVLHSDLSVKSEQASINEAFSSARQELNRLDRRWKDIVRVKGCYDQRQLEARKESCASCKGSGSVLCARCKGAGELLEKEKVPCPICGENDYKGQILKTIGCRNCGGAGEIRLKCGACKGKGTRRYAGKGGRMDSYGECNRCEGTGRQEQTCPKCSGRGKCEVWQPCTSCNGRGEVVNGNKVECPVCDGKTKLICERCAGKGYTFRPEQ